MQRKVISVLRNMNRTTTVVVALIAPAGYRQWYMQYQNNVHWHGEAVLAAVTPLLYRGFRGCRGFGGCGGCGGFGGGFAAPQLSRLSTMAAVALASVEEENSSMVVASAGRRILGDGSHKHVIQTIHQTNDCTGNGQDQKYGSDRGNQTEKDKPVICLNTAVNNAGHGFGRDSGSETAATWHRLVTRQLKHRL